MRSNTLDAAQRAYLGLCRGIVMSSDDSGAVQTISVRLMQNEMPTQVERLTQYGVHSVARDPDQNGAAGAEVVVGFMHGARSHPVVIADHDRRYKPVNWKPGDVGNYHHTGATAKFADDGWNYDGGDTKLQATWTIGNLKVTWADGKATVQVGGDGGVALVVKPDAVYAGGDPDKGGSFFPVETTGGTSNFLKAKVG